MEMPDGTQLMSTTERKLFSTTCRFRVSCVSDLFGRKWTGVVMVLYRVESKDCVIVSRMKCKRMLLPGAELCGLCLLCECSEHTCERIEVSSLRNWMGHTGCNREKGGEQFFKH